MTLLLFCEMYQTLLSESSSSRKDHENGVTTLEVARIDQNKLRTLGQVRSDVHFIIFTDIIFVTAEHGHLESSNCYSSL